METSNSTEQAPSDALALVMRAAEVVGTGVALWYMYRLLRQDPDFEAWRAKVVARVGQMRAHSRFARVETIVPEAEYILSESGSE